MGESTLILKRFSEGDQHAVAELMPLVCAELRPLAAAKMDRGLVLEPINDACECLLKSGLKYPCGIDLASLQ